MWLYVRRRPSRIRIMRSLTICVLIGCALQRSTEVSGSYYSWWRAASPVNSDVPDRGNTGVLPGYSAPGNPGGEPFFPPQQHGIMHGALSQSGSAGQPSHGASPNVRGHPNTISHGYVSFPAPPSYSLPHETYAYVHSGGAFMTPQGAPGYSRAGSGIVEAYSTESSYRGTSNRSNTWMRTAANKAINSVRQKLGNLSRGIGISVLGGEDPLELLQAEIARVVGLMNRLSAFCVTEQYTSLLHSTALGYSATIEAIDARESERHAASAVATARQVLQEAAALVELLYWNPIDKSVKEVTSVFQGKVGMLREASSAFRSYLQALRGAVRSRIASCAPVARAPRLKITIQTLWKRTTARANSVIKYALQVTERLVGVAHATRVALREGITPESRADFRLTDKVLSVSELIDSIHNRASLVRSLNSKLATAINVLVTPGAVAGAAPPLSASLLLGGIPSDGTTPPGFVSGASQLYGGFAGGSVSDLLPRGGSYRWLGGPGIGTGNSGLGLDAPEAFTSSGGDWGVGGTGRLPAGSFGGSAGGGHTTEMSAQGLGQTPQGMLVPHHWVPSSSLQPAPALPRSVVSTRSFTAAVEDQPLVVQPLTTTASSGYQLPTETQPRSAPGWGTLSPSTTSEGDATVHTSGPGLDSSLLPIEANTGERSAVRGSTGGQSLDTAPLVSHEASGDDTKMETVDKPKTADTSAMVQDNMGVF